MCLMIFLFHFLGKNCITYFLYPKGILNKTGKAFNLQYFGKVFLDHNGLQGCTERGCQEFAPRPNFVE